jgi:cystathionine beta-lyase
MPEKRDSQEMITQLLHHNYQPPTGFSAPQFPIYQASTVYFSSVEAMRSHHWETKQGYSYGLHGTPSTFMLEERLATLEGGRYCSLYPSGLAAIAHVGLAILQHGDSVAIPENAYTPNLACAQEVFKRFGIGHTVYNPMEPASLKNNIHANTRLVWLEVPGSISMEFAPLGDLVRICKDHNILCALDNTWGAGLAFNPFSIEASTGKNVGVDISVQALTKYPSGGADVLLGSIVTWSKSLHLQLKKARMHLGWGVGIHDVSAILKGLPTIKLRYEAQDRSARVVANHFQKHSAISEVLHPALAGEKTNRDSHAHWKRTCHPYGGLAAGLFSIVFKKCYSQEQIDRFCESLQLFKLGFSWGGPVSLAMPYDMQKIRKQRTHIWQDMGGLVRFSIGLEDTQDLLQDIDQALNTLV